jgi:hypothetical protein
LKDLSLTDLEENKNNADASFEDSNEGDDQQ